MLKKDLPNCTEAIVQSEKPDNHPEILTIQKRLLTDKKLLKRIKNPKRSNMILRTKKVNSKRKTHINSKKGKVQMDDTTAAKPLLNDPQDTLPTQTILSEPVSQLSKSMAFDNRLTWIMAIACGLSVANLVYMQPLLADLGHSFAVSVSQLGFIAMLSLLGFASGLILIVPLGDKYNQRTLIIGMLCVVAMALAMMALAPTIALLAIASYAVGLTSIIPELILPFVASLAQPNERGRIVGTVISGLLVGALLARTVGGFVGEHLGWRAMYWIAAMAMIVLALVLLFLLPTDYSSKREISYPQLLGSLWKLLRSEPVLQEVSIFGILAFGSFNIFWVALSFFLEAPPYHYGSEVTGLFSLAGIAGALATSFVGNFTDRRDARLANGAALAVMLLSFVVMWFMGQWLISLIIGVILLDLGAQSNQVSNQTRVYSLNPAARNRLNTIYMFMFSLGGSLGSMLGIFGWSVAKWNGVCGIACLMLIVALGFYILNSKRIQQWRKMHEHVC